MPQPSLSIPESAFHEISGHPNMPIGNGEMEAIPPEVVLELRRIMRGKVFACIDGAEKDTAEVFGADAPRELFNRVRESIELVIQSDPFVFTQVGLANGVVKGVLYQKASADLALMKYAYAVLFQKLEQAKRDFQNLLNGRIAELEQGLITEESALKVANESIAALVSNRSKDFGLAARRADFRRTAERLKPRVSEKRITLRNKRRSLEGIGRFRFHEIFLEIRDRPTDEAFERARSMIDDFLAYLKGAGGDVPKISLENIFRELMTCEVAFEKKKEEQGEKSIPPKKPKRRRTILPLAIVAVVHAAALAAVVLGHGKGKKSIGATASLSASANPPDIFRTETAIRADIMRIFAEHPLRVYFDLFEQGGERKVFVRAGPYPELSSAPYFQHLFVGFKYRQEGDYEDILSLERRLGDDMQQGRYFSLAEFESVRHQPLVATAQYRDPNGDIKNFPVGGGVVPIFSPELSIFIEVQESRLPLPPNPYRDGDE